MSGRMWKPMETETGKVRVVGTEEREEAGKKKRKDRGKKIKTKK